MGILAFLRLLRAKQWIKNGFILTPLVFAGKFQNEHLWQTSIAVFAAFSMVASAIYIINDIIDQEKDRVHPQKSSRPIASGEVKPAVAWFVSACCGLGGLYFLYMLGRPLFVVAVFYVLLQALYNLATKHYVILDVLTVAFGFQIRIWLGAIAIGVTPSLWLQLCVLALSLFLGFTKRRYEMVSLKDKGVDHRGVLNEYTIYFLDQMIIISSTLSIVFYGLYSISSEVAQRIGGNELLYSICFVIYGMFRYLYLLHVKKLGDDPGEVLLRDVPLLLDIVAWLFFIMLLMVCR